MDIEETPFRLGSATVAQTVVTTDFYLIKASTAAVEIVPGLVDLQGLSTCCTLRDLGLLSQRRVEFAI